MPGPDYDLTRRAPVGDARRYRCEELFNILDDAGRPAQRQHRTGELREEVISILSNGSPVDRWVYSNFRCEIERNYLDDDYGLHEAVKQFWAASPEDLLPPMGTIVIESATEQGDVFYPDTDTFGLSKTKPSAYMTAELCLHTRQFSMLATHAHGGIHQLRRVGDCAKMAFAGRADHVHNGDMFSATVTRAPNSEIRFEATTTRQGKQVALLTYNTPYEVSSPGWGPVHCEQVGRLWVDLDSGWVVAGRHYQTNYMGGVPALPDGKHIPVNVRFETSLEMIS